MYRIKRNYTSTVRVPSSIFIPQGSMGAVSSPCSTFRGSVPTPQLYSRPATDNGQGPPLLILPFASVPLLPILEEEKIKITIRDSSAYKNYIDPDSLQLAIGGRKKKVICRPVMYSRFDSCANILLPWPGTTYSFVQLSINFRDGRLKVHHVTRLYNMAINNAWG